MDPMNTERQAIRLGPMALRLLARRRRWLRWLAVALAGLTAASAISHAHRRGAVRPAEMPTVIVRHALPAGRPIGWSDVALETRQAPGATSIVRVEDAVGRVPVRPLRAGEAVMPDVAVSPLRYYGVAARVPRGMRAVNLVVPSAETFGGELAPMSRVDLLAAFELGSERAAATLLTTGIVLRVLRGREAVPPAGGRLGAGLTTELGRPGTVVEVAVAVPEAREREVALAQAFGRISIAVHPLAETPPRPDAPGVVDLRRYLGIPPTAPVPVPPPLPRGWPAASPGRMTPLGAAGRSGRVGDDAGQTPRWAVEVIEGAERSVEQVPRAGGSGGVDNSPPVPPARMR